MTSDQSKEEKKPCCKSKTSPIMRPSELPLYGNPHPANDIVHVEESGAIESSIRTARETTSPYFGMIASSGRRGMEVLSTAYAHSRSLYGRISEEGSAIPKAAAITAGGLTGLLIASRRGFIRKILYTSLGLTAAAAVCYPDQSRELMDLTAYIARRRGPDLIKEIIGVDVTPYLDPKKLDRIKSIDSNQSASGSSSPSSDTST